MLPTRNYSARDTAITQRPTSTALFVVDSEDRFNNYIEARSPYASSPYEFSITQPSSLMNGFFTRLAVTEVNFPWVIPNISTKTNKIFVQWVVGASPTINEALIELNYGFYTPSQLAAELQVAVRAADAALVNFTMVYGVLDVPGKPLVNNYPGFTYKSNDATITIGFKPMVPLSSDYPYASNVRQLFDVLGLNDENNMATLDPVAYTQDSFSGITYCQSIRYIDLVCSQLVYNQALKDTGSQKSIRDSLCRIYVVEPGSVQATTATSSATFCPPGCSPTTLYRDFSYPKQIQWLPNQPIVGALRFIVYDDEGDELALSDVIGKDTGIFSQNKTNWSMTMLVTEN
jgi:hypothetical protein